MIRKPITLYKEDIPLQFHPFLDNAVIFDSSCSPEARVYFLDSGPGFYLKNAPKGKLQKEAALTAFFHSRQLGPEVILYESLDADWMLTRRVTGEDCTYKAYLDDPIRLCDTAALLLRMLHETPFAGCPVPDRTMDYLKTAHRNHARSQYDLSLISGSWHYKTADDAWRIVEEGGKLLKSDTLLHGDYCLPNIMLNDWKFSGFIDLDSAGVGDKHVDLFWGIWSLQYNLKTDRYQGRFLDAYGRDSICEDLLSVVAAVEVFG